MRRHEHTNSFYKNAITIMALTITILLGLLTMLICSMKTVTSENGSTLDSVSAVQLSAATTGILSSDSSITSTSGDGNVISAVEKAADSVVEIITETKQVNAFASQFVTSGAGSGVILTENGYIVTNHHVIEKAGNITVKLRSGEEYAAVLIGTDEKTDLAVLKIDATGLTPATFADSRTIQVGQVAVAIGNPLGSLGGTVTEGIVSARDREITIDNQTMTLIQTSAAVNPGNSGGGLFDSSGNLIGVVNAKSSGTDIEGLAFAIPSNMVSEVAGQIMEIGYVSGRPQLGITMIEISDSRAAMRYRVNSTGMYVAESNANGLEAGDRIISINDAAVSSTVDVNSILDKCQVGDTVLVVVSRNGSEITVPITLTEKIPQTQAA